MTDTLPSYSLSMIRPGATKVAAAGSERKTTQHSTITSTERAQHEADVFHDAREEPCNDPSSSCTSPNASAPAGPTAAPNSGMKGDSPGDEDSLWDSTPRQPPLTLNVSPWDEPSFPSNNTSPACVKSVVLPAPISLTTPTSLKSPLDGAIRRRGSIKGYHASRHSLDIKELQLHSSSRKPETIDQSAFWQQFKSKFIKRSKNGIENAAGRPNLQVAERLKSPTQPLASPPNVSLKVHEDTSGTLQQQSAWCAPPLRETDYPHSGDPLMQVLVPCISPRQATSSINCEHPMCPTRTSIDSSLLARHSPPLSRRSFDAAADGCQRQSSIRKLKKRSASIRRSSISASSYVLVSPEEMVSRLKDISETQTHRYLVLDTSPAHFYASSPNKLRNTVNVSIPSLLVKRFRQGNFASFALKSFLPDEESQRTFYELCPDGKLDSTTVCIVDEQFRDKELFCNLNTSMAAILAAGITHMAKNTGTPSPSILVLRGKIEDTVALASAMPKLLVESQQDITRSDVGGPRLPPSSGITSGRLFSTPTTMTSLSPSRSLESALLTPRQTPQVESHEGVPIGLVQAGAVSKATFRKARPLQLQRIDTSGDVKRKGFAPQKPSTPLRLLDADNASASETRPMQETCLPLPLPRTAFVQAGNSAPSRLPAIVMPEESQVTPRGEASSFTVSVIIPGFLYLGPEPLQEEDAQALEGVGIKRILNVATECNTQDRWRGRFEKIATIPMRDSLAETNVQERFEEACLLLDDADLLAKPTFVHCKAGKSRSVTIILAYLIHRNHWPLKRAYAHVLDRRKGVSPNIGFVAELMRFEEAELGGRSKGILGTGLTPANEHTEYFGANRVASAGATASETKLPDPPTPRSARSDLEGRPTVVRHLSFIASTAMGINTDKPRTRDQRSSTHIARNRDSMPPGMVYSQYNVPSDTSNVEDM